MPMVPQVVFVNVVISDVQVHLLAWQ